MTSYYKPISGSPANAYKPLASLNPPPAKFPYVDGRASASTSPYSRPAPLPGKGGNLLGLYFARRSYHYPEPAPEQPTELLLHPLVALHSQPLINYDLAFTPKTNLAIPKSFPMSELYQPATQPATAYLRIISESLLWPIEINNVSGAPISVVQIFESIYAELQPALIHTEWAMATKMHQEHMSEAYARRCDALSNPKAERAEGVKRVDWLGKMTAFVGLVRDDGESVRWLGAGAPELGRTLALRLALRQ